MQSGLATSARIFLNPDFIGVRAQNFQDEMFRRVIGQDKAVSALTRIFQTQLANISRPDKPLGSLLYLGPTGSGKTHVGESAAEILFNNINLVTKIDCAEFQHPHEISKLIGAPPGFLGHRETNPILSQENLDKSHTNEQKVSLVIFDEIEKASDTLLNLLLGILDKARLTTGSNTLVSFSRCIMIFTSNLGAREMSRITRGGIGFVPAIERPYSEMESQIHEAAISAAKKKFLPELFNRFDEVVVFNPLSMESIKNILEIELRSLEKRMYSKFGNTFFFKCTERAKEFIIRKAYSVHYGARHLKRAIERYIVTPASAILSTGQINTGDTFIIDLEPQRRDTLSYIRQFKNTEIVKIFNGPRITKQI